MAGAAGAFQKTGSHLFLSSVSSILATWLHFSENRYLGLYHTDETIRSPYFDENLRHRDDVRVRDDLYFTYLHSLAEEAYLSMGLGQELQQESHEDSVSEFESGSEP